MAKRIMLVEVTPKEPVNPVYATWNPSDKHSEITLSNGNLTATKNVTHATNWRGVRSTVGISAEQWYWETTYSFAGASADLAAGISRLDWDLVTQIGRGVPLINGESLGGPIRNGDCYYWNAVIANVGIVANSVVIRHWLDMDSRIYRIAVGAGSWATIRDESNWFSIYPSTVPWYPGATFLRPSGTTCLITANFGASPFVYSPPPGVNRGVYAPQPHVPLNLYLSSDRFGTGSGDTPANQPYLARIVADQDVEETRAAGCWVWGNSSTAKAGQVVVTNIDGGLDDWAKYDWRDAQITIYEGEEGFARNQFTVWKQARVNMIRFEERRISIQIADPLALYDTPIQTNVYPETHPIEAEIGNPIPISFGLPFYCTGVRITNLTAGADAFAWQFHDGIAPLLTSKGTIYDNGIDISSACVAWPAAPPIKGFRVTGTAPKGKVTCSVSGNGSTTVLTIVQQAAARLPAHRSYSPSITQQAGGVSGIGSWACIYIKQAKTILAVIREAMDSVCGWACPTRAGNELRLSRVRDPAGLTPVLELNRSNVEDGISVELDTANRLTTRLSGRRNWSPHAFNEIAASISDPASGSYNPNLTENLQAEYMVTRDGTPVVVNGSQVSAAYEQARSAPAKATLLQESAHIKAEANRVCTLWYPTRHFVHLTAILTAVDAAALEPGDPVRLTWPRYGLDNGRTFIVASVTTRFWSRKVKLVLWGTIYENKGN